VTRDDLLAVVVSFNGVTTLRRTVEALLPQAGEVCIVDNGSDAATAGVLAHLEKEPGVSVIRLGENRGIGAALNAGARRARDTGRSWLLTMDQDSVADGGMIAAYAAALKDRPELVSLAPRIGGPLPSAGAAIQEVGYAITSGNCVKLSVVDEAGGFDDSLFIDSVDFDFSLRVRRAGHRIHRISAAVLHHQLGEVREVPPLFRRVYSEHSPLRRYYISRNFLYMVQRHLLRFPLFICKLTLAHLAQLLAVGFLDPRPGASYAATFRGIRDFLRQRTGPAPAGVR
jgi:rhamnosyltransferase